MDVAGEKTVRFGGLVVLVFRVPGAALCCYLEGDVAGLREGPIARSSRQCGVQLATPGK